MLTVLPPFLGACTLVAAAPGPSTVLIIRHSLRSRRAGFATVLGNETGVLVWGLCAAFGLTALLAASQLAYDVVRIAGAAVLVWFGVQALRAARRGPDPERAAAGEDAAVTPWAAYRAGLGMNLANPKAAVFAMSFLPQFVPSGAPQLPAMAGLAALWAVYEVGYYGVYVWFVDRLRSVFGRAAVRRRLEAVSGGVLVALGVRMALEG
ncbi:LysE family translocator [Actinacidiphila glaucinigra]|uniref:LysE family translocator n=1 Tax=Actinacidiphila glaucinigra TaxID=235986 RepID=UPI0037234740